MLKFGSDSRLDIQIEYVSDSCPQLEPAIPMVTSNMSDH